MFHAIEARSPFLDQSLWEWGASLPYATRLRGLELKAVLRALVRKNIGADIARRPKRYFTVPVQRWLIGPWKSHVVDVLDNPLLESDGWLKRGTLATAWQQAAEHRDAPNQLWYLVVLESWLRRQRRNHASLAPLQPWSG
jgi:asparagine synthase (glutamine-hydrolysing)